MDAARAQLLIDSKCTLGEGATWCASSGRFYWTDIEGKRLWRYDPRDRTSVSFAMPERLACFALCADPDALLLGLASRLAFFDLATGAIETITEVEAGLPTRLNDGRCDRQGRFVFGTKHDVDQAEAIGGFYRLNGDLSLERLPLADCAISNSIAFSPDGATMYYCDSPTRQIRVCDYPSRSATIACSSSFRMRRAFPMARPSIAMAACGMRSGAARASCAMRPTAARPRASTCRPRSRVALLSAARSSTRCT